jgi:hypothetical protein
VRAGDQSQDRHKLGITFPISLLGRADEVIRSMSGLGAEDCSA